MRYRRHPRTASRSLEGRAVIIGVDQNRLFTLSSTGSFLWESLAEPRSLDELATALVRRFRVDAPTARGDCLRFCDDLLSHGLLECVP
jgi:hypothetical protein